MEYHTRKKFNATPSEIYKDFESYALMKQWMIKDDFGQSVVNGDFSNGGKFHIEMTSDIGDISHYYGEYTAITPNKHIDMVWNDNEVRDTLVSFDFISHEDKSTTVVLVHANLKDRKSLVHHREFWRKCLDNLERILNSK